MNTDPNAKRILCYGDSNTRGMIPSTDLDFLPVKNSWPGVLQDILGIDYEIISEGLYGRTLVVDEDGKRFKTGVTHLEAILKSHMPLDLLIIMLGTNDVKGRYGLSSEEISMHLEQSVIYAKKILGDKNLKILIICPPAVAITVNGNLNPEMQPGLDTFKTLPDLFKNVAKKNDCSYINAGEFFTLENTDGYHMSEEHHKILGGKVAELIRETLK